ncbi:MAG: L-threonylcarbamoyladenylate synthase [Candidatus Micrarchaeota archaeon]
MTAILKISDDDYESAVDVAHTMLHSRCLMVYPTDTVYGIGGDATSAEVVGKIHKLKGIRGRKPMSVMVSDFGMIEYFCDTGVWEDMILDRYLPGPYTFILKKKRDLPASDTDRLGIRMPDSPFCKALCEVFGKPIITTSANLTGGIPPTKLEDVEKKVLDGVDLAIDGGFTKYRCPSPVIDLVDRTMKREGSNEKIDLVRFPER